MTEAPIFAAAILTLASAILAVLYAIVRDAPPQPQPPPVELQIAQRLRR